MSIYARELPTLYTTFFLTIEPICAFLGALYAYIYPADYLYTTHPPSFYHPPTNSENYLNPATNTVLDQLANLYLLFAINEALVLRAAYDTGKGKGWNLKIWRTLLFGLLVADLGYLWSVRNTGSVGDVYGRFWEWDTLGWGNVGFVYFGASMRICFLAGIGIGREKTQ